MKKIEIAIIFFITIVLFWLFGHLAYIERGGSGVGGEVMVLLLPILYYQFKPKIKKKTKSKRRYHLVTPQQYKSSIQR